MRSLAIWVFFSLGLTAPAHLHGQGSSEEEVYELSPFIVETEEGTYMATSTLAGSRVRTNVSELGSSISILSPQLLQDVGATDAGSVLTVVPNMEVTGELGNFSGATPSEESFQADNSRQSFSSTQRVRGLANAQTTRNYFLCRQE